MAKMTIMAGDDYAIKLSQFATQSDEISKKAIYAGADIIADKIKSNLKENLHDPASVAKGGGDAWGVKFGKSLGDLLESFGITPIKRDKNGDWNAKIGFDGYDSKGVPNQLKARAMESGTSTLRKRPFVRPAVNATKKQVIDKMNQVIDEEIKKIKL